MGLETTGGFADSGYPSDATPYRTAVAKAVTTKRKSTRTGTYWHVGGRPNTNLAMLSFLADFPVLGHGVQLISLASALKDRTRTNAVNI